MGVPEDLRSSCDRLRSLHRAGKPLLLPNAWDVATARAVVAAGFPAVATTSWGVAGCLGHEDDEQAPADEMIAAAARIIRGVDVPVTVDAEAGYGMAPADVARMLRSIGASGCNLEDTAHTGTGVLGNLRSIDEQATWLAGVRDAAAGAGHDLVINARVDTFLEPYVAGADPGSQLGLVPDAVARSNGYLEAGADCVYPVALWEADALQDFMHAVDGPVNLTYLPQTGSLTELVGLGAVRIRWAIFLYEEAMARFAAQLAAIVASGPAAVAGAPGGS